LAAPIEDSGKENVENSSFLSKRVIDIVTFRDFYRLHQNR
jgi:hypothetical protein